MSDWQPIDTAPKDGTSVVLAMYVGQSLQWLTLGSWTTTADWYAKTRMENREKVTGWHGSGGNPLRAPTHWTPLPLPPMAQGVQQP